MTLDQRIETGERLAREAARAAARAALRPTVVELQQSALGLVERMAAL